MLDRPAEARDKGAATGDAGVNEAKPVAPEKASKLLFKFCNLLPCPLANSLVPAIAPPASIRKPNPFPTLGAFLSIFNPHCEPLMPLTNFSPKSFIFLLSGI